MLRRALVRGVPRLGLLASAATSLAGQTPAAGARGSASRHRRGGHRRGAVRRSRPRSRSSTARSSCSGRACWDASPAERADGAGTRARRSGRAADHRARRIAAVRRRRADHASASRGVLALTPPDVDELSGETLDGVAARTVERLQQALDEAAEARTPGALLRSAAAAAAVLALACWRCGASRRAHRVVAPQARRHRRADGRQSRASPIVDVAPRLAPARLSSAGSSTALIGRARSRRDLRHDRRSCFGSSPTRGPGASRCAGSC